MSRIRLPQKAVRKRSVGRYGGADYKHDKSVLSFGTAAELYNFCVESGALRTGYGVQSSPAVSERAQRFWVYRYYSDSHGKYVDQYIFQDRHGRLTYHDVDEDHDWFMSAELFPPVNAINYRINSKDVLLILCEDSKILVWNGKTLTTALSDARPSSMALHYERLFVTSSTEPTKVFFSKNLDPTCWDISADGGGFIELLDERGFLNKVVSFGSYLYIFRDHGISRLTAFGDQSEFSVVNMFVTAGRIFPSSICTCGNVIMFLASDGLYVFDGYGCTRTLTNLEGLIEPNDSCASAYFDGKYYLACKMNFGGDPVGCESGEYTVNGLVVYDPASGECSVSRGLNITSLNAVTLEGNDYLVCCESGTGGVVTRCGKRFDESLPKLWKSPDSDLSCPGRRKTVKSVCLASDVPASVTVAADGKKTVRAVDGSADINVFAVGERISVGIGTSAAECNIAPVTLYYEVENG